MQSDGFWSHIVRDLTGAGHLRLIMQPLLAVVLGVRVGIADAKAGEQPFLMRLLRGKHDRWRLFRDSISHAALPLTVALGLDAILQHLSLGRVRPLAAVVVGTLLVWLPFTITRGLSNRLWMRGHPPLGQRAA